MGEIWAAGAPQEITPEHQMHGRRRFEEKLALAQRTGNHLWTAISHYFIDPEQSPLHLDAENLCGPPVVGCFRCEEPYTPQLALRRCKGDVPIGDPRG